MSEALNADARWGIGKVLDELRTDFPELTLSKLRYLEQEGLVDPVRTPAGYRKYGYGDVERLRFVLRMQRDNFWPLSHIRQVLDEMDRGQIPDTEERTVLAVPHIALGDDEAPTEQTMSDPVGSARLSRDELMDAADIDEKTLQAIEEFGLIRRRPNQRFYDNDAVVVASLVGSLASLGVEPRHLTGMRAAVDRELGLFNQVVPVASRQGEEGSSRLAQLAALTVRLHTALVRNGLRG